MEGQNVFKTAKNNLEAVVEKMSKLLMIKSYIFLTCYDNFLYTQFPPPPPLCFEWSFTRTFPRNQDATVKLKSELISIKFKYYFNTLADTKLIFPIQTIHCWYVL